MVERRNGRDTGEAGNAEQRKASPHHGRFPGTGRDRPVSTSGKLPDWKDRHTMERSGCIDTSSPAGYFDGRLAGVTGFRYRDKALGRALGRFQAIEATSLR